MSTITDDEKTARALGNDVGNDDRDRRWTFHERRDIIRELIVHEDKLSGERIQALYALHGFLFATLGLIGATGATQPSSSPHTGVLPPHIAVLVLAVSAVGVLSAIVYRYELRLTGTAITELMKDWTELQRECKNVPKVIGRYGPRPPRMLSRRAVPSLLIAIWSFVFLLAAYFLLQPPL